MTDKELIRQRHLLDALYQVDVSYEVAQDEVNRAWMYGRRPDPKAYRRCLKEGIPVF